MSELNDTKSIINLGNREIILIGTAHISRESIDEVSRVIREEKPFNVCVELDASRYAAMTQKDTWEKLNMTKVFKEGKGFLLIANLVLSGFQRRMGSELGVKPGEEMKAALETAAELGIPHSLCDREIQFTLRRAWGCCSLWNKLKLLAALLASAFSKEKLSPEEIEKLKKRNELDGMMSELAEFLPGVKKALIDERDQYLASKIWTSISDPVPPVNAEAMDAPAMEASLLLAVPAAMPEQKIRTVAVVGAGHMEGIKTHLDKLFSGEESPDVKELDKVPKPTNFTKIAGFILPILIIGLLTAGYFIGGADMTLEAAKHWVFWNGSLAAVGAVLALSHPLVILISFLSAPITSLTPIIGVGMVAGLLQVTIRKPRVSDVESLPDDISSLKGIYRNRISKGLLVFIMSTLGSTAGTFFAGANILGIVFG